MYNVTHTLATAKDFGNKNAIF